MSDEPDINLIDTMDDRRASLENRPRSKGVHPDFTAPSIFFHGVTAHSVGSGGFSLSLEVERATQALDGSLASERVFAGVLRCASVNSMRQLKQSVDLLLLAAEGSDSGASN